VAAHRHRRASSGGLIRLSLNLDEAWALRDHLGAQHDLGDRGQESVLDKLDVLLGISV